MEDGFGTFVYYVSINIMSAEVPLFEHAGHHRIPAIAHSRLGLAHLDCALLAVPAWNGEGDGLLYMSWYALLTFAGILFQKCLPLEGISPYAQ